MAKVEFHRSDRCIVQGDKCARLSYPDACVFYNLWTRRGEWLTVDEILLNMDGKPVKSVNPKQLLKSHMAVIRKTIKEAEIDLEIETQYLSFWSDTKYRIAED